MFVQLRETRAGLHIHRLTVHQRRANEAEVGHRRIELIDKIKAPAFLAGFRVQAHQQVAHTGYEQARSRMLLKQPKRLR